MDNRASFLLLFSLLLGQLTIYRRHRRGGRGSGARYPVSLPTRLFRWVKGPLYGVIVLHLVLALLRSPSAPAPRGLLPALGMGVLALGLLEWSLRTLGRNFAPCDRGIMPREVVRSGPYRWLRHPIYTANLLLVGAVAVVSLGPLIAAAGVALAAFYAFAIRDESRVLRRLAPGGAGEPR